MSKDKTVPREDGEAETEAMILDSQFRLTIPGDVVKTSLARLRETDKIDEDGESLVWWFYCHARENNWRLQDAAGAIGKDKTTVHRLFNGTYGAAYSGLVEAISAYKKFADERAKRRDIGFVETSTWRKIEKVCRSALFDSMPAFVYGASQIGKTACLREYARRNNHGETKYVRMPSAPSFPFFVKHLADACYLSSRLRSEDLRKRIMATLDDRTLLIVDEFHQCMVTTSELTARRIAEFLREVYDVTGCGIVICGTKVLKDEMERGRQAVLLDQFRRRGMLELVLPDRPPLEDVAKIARAFDLPPPDGDVRETVKSMLQESGVGKYIKFLQYANGVAVNRKERLAWAHFLEAYAAIKSLSH